MKKNENKTVALKRRVSSVHAKAEAVGIFYLIATVLIAAAAFLPILYGTSVGDMWVVNFWKAFPDVVNIKTSAVAALLNAGCAGLYALLLLTAVINVLRSLSRMSRLFKTKASKVNGYNRNAMAMEEMGKIYSGTYCVFIVFPFMIHLISGAGFTNLYYIAIAVGLVFHFWLGLVGGNVSQFTVGTETEEEKRTLGRIAPFFRNFAQLVFVGLIMYYISETNLMLNALKWLETNAFSTLFKGAKMDLVYYGAIPFLQLLCCLWTVVLLKHATAPTEYHRDGMDAPGMKNFRVFSFLLLITSGLLVGLMFLAATKRTFIAPTIGTLFIAVIALAALIEEFCMCRLPNVKGKVAEDPIAEATEEAETVPEEAAPAQPEAQLPTMYHIPLQCISQPGVFMQPNGQPVLLMPMIAGTQVDPHQAPADGRQIMYGYQNPYEVPYGYGPYGAYWNNGRPFNPYQYVQEPAPEAADETQETKETETATEPEKKPDVKERKANLAADKKALRQEAALSRKEHKAAAERAAVEQALAEKWIKKAKKQPVEESNAVTASATPEKEEKAVSVASAPVASESTALMPVQAAPRQPMMETYAYSHPFAHVKSRYYPEATELSEEDLMKPLPPKKWTVTCPDCMSKLTVKDGAFAYRCPECGGVFQLRKVFRAKQNNENTEN